jgi:hypothetical protein
VKLYADEDHVGREADVCPDVGWMRMWRWMPRYAVNALKKGIQRGTPKSEQEDGRVYVGLDTDQDTGGTVESGALISAKDETIRDSGNASPLWSANWRPDPRRRKDHIIATLTQRTPELLAGAHQERAQDVAAGAGGVRGAIREWRPSDELRDSPCERSELVAKNFSATARKVGGSSLGLQPTDLLMKDEDLST